MPNTTAEVGRLGIAWETHVEPAPGALQGGQNPGVASDARDAFPFNLSGIVFSTFDATFGLRGGGDSAGGGVFNVVKFGAVGDGKTADSGAAGTSAT